jgi:hypothetical protein
MTSELFVRLSWFDMYKYREEGGIYSAGARVWHARGGVSHLGSHVALLVEWNIKHEGGAVTTLSFCNAKYFRGPAIAQFPNTDSTVFNYLTVQLAF